MSMYVHLKIELHTAEKARDVILDNYHELENKVQDQNAAVDALKKIAAEKEAKLKSLQIQNLKTTAAYQAHVKRLMSEHVSHNCEQANSWAIQEAMKMGNQ